LVLEYLVVRVGEVERAHVLVLASGTNQTRSRMRDFASHLDRSPPLSGSTTT
jgi:hypothetical protein